MVSEAVSRGNENFLSKEDWEAIGREQDEVKAEAAREKELFREVFSTSAGKEVLDFICKRLCNEDLSAFSENALQMAKNSALHDVARVLRAIVSKEDESKV